MHSGPPTGAATWELPQEPECPPGWDTAPPDFVGIGASMCGTTCWFSGALLAHPLVAAPPGQVKEIHFFDRYWTEDVESDFPTRYARYFPRPQGSVAGEWSPNYMYDPWTPPLLGEVAPDARYLIMLRDSVERYRSNIAPVVNRLRRQGYDALSIVLVSNAIFHSTYHAQVKRAFEVLGRDRVIVLRYERCVEQPLAQMQRTQRFVGLEPLAAIPPALERHVPSGGSFGGRKPPLPARVRSELSSSLADDVRQVAALCPELDVGLWPNFAAL